MSTTPRRPRPWVRTEQGTATAEVAVVLPMLVLLTLGLVWVVTVGVAHVRAVDAARETARALARGEERADAIELGQRVATSGARFTVHAVDGVLTVSVTAPVRGPGGLLSSVGDVEVKARAVAAEEVVR